MSGLPLGGLQFQPMPGVWTPKWEPAFEILDRLPFGVVRFRLGFVENPAEHLKWQTIKEPPSDDHIGLLGGQSQTELVNMCVTTIKIFQ